MILKRFYDESLAHASYLVGCPGSGEAIVVDPNRDVDQYLLAAKEEGLSIVGIAETHIHADYVSGTRQLSCLTGATMYLSSEGGSAWQYAFAGDSNATLVGDGNSFRVGAIRFDVLHTPGHTPEHISFLITDEAAGPDPLAIFTGDFVFVGDVGRPDLLEHAAGIVGTMEPGARALYHSIARFRSLPEYVTVWPAHGSGSACGKSLGGVPVSSVGYEARTSWAFKPMSESTFVSEVLAGQPDPPPYFAHMKVINRVGPPLLHGRVIHELTKLEGEPLLIDVRPAEDYARSHPIGALHLSLGRSFLQWAGWLVSTSDKFVLVANSPEEADLAAVKLSLIGVDSVAGWIRPFRLLQRATKTAESIQPGQEIIDVRSEEEWSAGHLAQADHVPLTRLRNVATQYRGHSVAVHCRSGKRALIGASILERAGAEDVTAISTPFAELSRSELRDAAAH